jgi:hypothetical protein
VTSPALTTATTLARVTTTQASVNCIPTIACILSKCVCVCVCKSLRQVQYAMLTCMHRAEQNMECEISVAAPSAGDSTHMLTLSLYLYVCAACTRTGTCRCSAGWQGPGCKEPYKRRCYMMGDDKRDRNITDGGWVHTRCSGTHTRTERHTHTHTHRQTDTYRSLHAHTHMNTRTHAHT